MGHSPLAAQSRKDRTIAHLIEGVCNCDCERCTVIKVDTDGEEVTTCICPDCNAEICGMHSTPSSEVEKRQVGF